VNFPDPVSLATPAFILLVVIELVMGRWNGTSRYEANDTATSLLMGFGSVVAGISLGFIGYSVFTLAAPYALFDFGYAWPVIVICFIADDLAYYVFHRAAHRVRWFWASHVIHHSSQYYNLSTALRQTWTGPLSLNFLFRLPLVLLGFPLEVVFFTAGINLVYQFWIHTETIDRLGPLEWVMNTPSHHRVHHATNPLYLDSNYAGTFIIWDRMFGTFVEERHDEPPVYGIVANIATFNPLRVAFHEWIAMFKDISRSKSVKSIFGFIFAPPGWTPDKSRETTDMIKARWRASKLKS
jgi:sterol desaturase/sphingolipid hydroxylase (fatty acid hydroxylase superfamily)